jgi:hypothetical protein
MMDTLYAAAINQLINHATFLFLYSMERTINNDRVLAFAIATYLWNIISTVAALWLLILVL